MRRLFTIIGLLGAIYSAPAIAFKDDYIRGVEEIERENWAAALGSLQRAAQQEPKSQDRIRLYGMRFSPYLPHYYIGVAQYHLGNCAEAQASFATARQNGVVSKLSENSRLQQLDSECANQSLASNAARQEQIDRLSNQIGAIRSEIARAGETRRDSLWTNQWQSNGQFQQQSTTLSNDLRRIETSLDQADDLDQVASDLAVLSSRVSQFANTVSQQLDSLRLAAQQRQADRQRELAELAQRSKQQEEQERQAQAEKAELNQQITTIVERANQIVTAWPEEISSDPVRAALAQSVRRAYAAGDAPLADLRAIERSLTTAIARGEQRLQAYQQELATRAPEQLIAAVDEYFQGNFEQAVDLLERASFDSKLAQYHRNVFTAAAIFHDAAQSSAQLSDQVLNQIERNLLAAKALDRTMPLDPNVFSPKFIELAETVVN